MEGSVGQEGGGIRGKKYTLAVSSVAHLCPTLCDPMDCSMLRLPCPSPTPGAYSNSSITSVMPSNHLILCHPLLLPPSIFPSIRVFSNESALHIRWPKYCHHQVAASVLPINTQDCSPLGWTGWISLLSKGRSRVLSNTIVQKHQFFSVQLSLSSNSHWKNHSFD